MHDRGDYLAGWQVEKNWNEAQEAKRKRALQGLGEEEEENYEIKADEELPWACLICREPFTNPVVTKSVPLGDACTRAVRERGDCELLLTPILSVLCCRCF